MSPGDANFGVTIPGPRSEIWQPVCLVCHSKGRRYGGGDTHSPLAQLRPLSIVWKTCMSRGKITHAWRQAMQGACADRQAPGVAAVTCVAGTLRRSWPTRQLLVYWPCVCRGNQLSTGWWSATRQHCAASACVPAPGGCPDDTNIDHGSVAIILQWHERPHESSLPVQGDEEKFGMTNRRYSAV